MKCSTQDSSTKRSKTMTNQRVSKQVLVSISMLKKRTFQSVFRTIKIVINLFYDSTPSTHFFARFKSTRTELIWTLGSTRGGGEVY